mmetsp:Transcript_22497/g.42902  ORF Transcript_22497/g.42902 Transcript_22497/m.42902 type:complete len:209 (+) Transcript_22497:290-916(+)
MLILVVAVLGLYPLCELIDMLCDCLAINVLDARFALSACCRATASCSSATCRTFRDTRNASMMSMILCASSVVSTLLRTDTESSLLSRILRIWPATSALSRRLTLTFLVLSGLHSGAVWLMMSSSSIVVPPLPPVRTDFLSCIAKVLSAVLDTWGIELHLTPQEGASVGEETGICWEVPKALRDLSCTSTTSSRVAGSVTASGKFPDA